MLATQRNATQRNANSACDPGGAHISCRKAGESAFVRKLTIPIDAMGYRAMFEIRDAQKVSVGAVRHQLESDCH